MRVLDCFSDFFMRNIYIFIGAVLIVFLAGLPVYYGLGAAIPNEISLATASGELIVEKAVKNRQDGIRLESGKEIYFDCGSGGACLSSEQRLRHVGAKAQVWWYELPNHIFDWRQRYLVKVVVEKNEILSKKDSEIRFNEWKSWNLYFLFGGVFFYICIARFFRDVK